MTRARYLMGTICEITARGAGASETITRAFEEIARLERVMSDYLPESELSSLNRRAGELVPLSADLWAILVRSIETSAESDGAFDVTYASPPEARGWQKIRLYPQRRAARLVPGAVIDLGGIGKGYALDAAASILRKGGIRSALLNFGGQVYALGTWPVRVGPLTLRVTDASVSTSGDSERPGHIRDPHTGKPVQKKTGVTVIAPTATDADAWDTPLYITGIKNLPPAFQFCAIELAPSAPPAFAGGCRAYLQGEARPSGERQPTVAGHSRLTVRVSP